MSVAPDQADGRDRYLGLSFSGGGYRAAAFSLGALALLKDLNLLGRATVLSGVSGGSIAVGAYLCAKAGAELENRSLADDDRCFYDTFYKPFITYLSTQTMAEGFVHLSWLLQKRKLIKAAADANHALFSDLLGQPALLGSDRIHMLLNNGRRSPDYAFFNAADISSLNLFRFGLQKHCGKDGSNDLAIVIGRWILTPQVHRNTTRQLYHFSKQLRMADCVAASHAFPLGLEPMVFPGDFVPSGPEGTKALEAFAGSEVCEGREALGLLDGGLYDNLGLASVEDIRENLYPQSRKTGTSAGPSAKACCAPFVVIATDVDNIQPGISFYDARQSWPKPGKRRSGVLIGLGFLALGAVVAALVVTSGEWAVNPKVVRVVIVLVALALLALPPAALPWLRSRLKPGVRRLLIGLGFSDAFVEMRSRSDSEELGQVLTLRGLIGEPFANLINALRFNLLVQRGGQPGPMVSGYLKRTRSLTYGYLEFKYRDERQHRGRPWPHLVRNMIFELTQGADCDPDYAAELITLPVQTLSTLNEEQEEVYRETSVMRKIRHAHFAAGLIQQRAQWKAQRKGGQQGVGDPTLPGRNPCLMEIWEAGNTKKKSKANHNGQENPDGPSCSHDQQLNLLIKRLHLTHAARLWDELWPALRVGPSGCESTQTTHPSSDMQRLLTHVCMVLQRALRQADLDEATVLENCRVTPEPVPRDYSWIPMICEMATNLPTTLWIEAFRYYVPNLIVDGQMKQPGQWSNVKPSLDELNGRPLLDLGTPQAISDHTTSMDICPTAAITTLAGYISTVFNLLEYYYSYLECSEALVNGLARTLASRSQAGRSGRFEPLKDCDCQKAVMELPFRLRQRVDQKLHQHWQWLQSRPDWLFDPEAAKPKDYDHTLLKRLKKLQEVSDPQVRLDLLKPWLRNRGPFPQGWWDGGKESTPSDRSAPNSSET